MHLGTTYTHTSIMSKADSDLPIHRTKAYQETVCQ